ncbi:MAG: LPS-assembly protein LptD [Deltaproteobacteria bacterium]|nr:LPS-assembly protein LptD [Deltaproteobacteria bacterium]
MKNRRLLKDNGLPWNISAKTLVYNEKEGTCQAEGDVVITKAGQTLYTQYAEFNVKTGIARVSGGLRLETEGDVVEGQKGTFNLNTQTGEITGASLFLRANHYYIHGSRMKKVGEASYVVWDCTLTTCDGANPDWTITGSEVNVTIEGYGTVKHSAFRVKGLPIIYVPYMIFPAKTKRQSGLLPPRAGYSTLNGAELEIPLYWAISDQTDATFYSRCLSSRGYMQGAEFRYIRDVHSKGALAFDILSDRKETKDMTDKHSLEISPFARTNRTRYRLMGWADQDLPLDLTARLDADYVSDQDYLREFEEKLAGFSSRENLSEESRRPFQEKRSPTRRSALRLSRDGESYILQGIGSYYQPMEDPAIKDNIQEPAGGINFTLIPEQIAKLPLFFNFESGYEYIWSDDADRGHSVSISPQINLPFWMGPYVQFEPSFSYTYNGLRARDDQGKKNNQYQTSYEGSARLTTNAERVYDLHWLNAQKLRHKISPVLTYTYRGYHTNADRTPWFSPVGGGRYESPWLEAIYEEETEDRNRNRIAFALENFLDARFQDKKGRILYQQWGTFKLYQGYDFDPETRDGKARPFTPLMAELIVRPFSSLELRGNARWDHDENAFTRSILSGSLSVARSGGRTDTYEVDYQYFKDPGEGQTNISCRADINLTYGFSAGASFQRDIEAGQSISSAGWLGYQSQCWGLKLGASREDGDTNVMVLVRLAGLGDTGEW